MSIDVQCSISRPSQTRFRRSAAAGTAHATGRSAIETLRARRLA